eukprot:TRINITY_DN14992_c0_g1_i1.p1 TRINITY_DN14992_c0_g1~~TRINITY_DN14992_c0_g1_i1.p1  ORF type:complete len:276 (+),score=33.38 TRINITY_DN14992_c0_g1_i1:31-858(+)
MTETVENTKLIYQDVRTSWYFRFWTLFWVICLIFGFVAFIIYSVKSGENSSNPPFHTWVETPLSIQFPSYQISIPDPASPVTFTSFSCNRVDGGSLESIRTVGCSVVSGSPPPMTKCREILANAYSASGKGNGIVKCTITTDPVNPVDPMIYWSLSPFYVASDYSAAWGAYVSPNNDSWIYLEKHVFEGVDVWRSTRTNQHSTISMPGVYTVSVAIDSFAVRNVMRYSGYNGWMSLGNTGGFAFFLVIMHTIVMMGVSVCLNNDSKFLRGKHAEM